MKPTRLLTALLSLAAVGFAEPVKVATFDVDATPRQRSVRSSRRLTGS